MDGASSPPKTAHRLSGDVVAALLAQVLISAGTYLAAKRAMAELSPLSLVALRVLASSAVYAVLLFALGGPRLPPRAQWGRALLLGLLAGPLNQGFFFHGLSSSTAAHGALLYALTPVGVYLWDVAAGIERLRARQLAGIGVAFAGVGVLLVGRGLAGALGPMKGDAFILVAVAAWVAYTRISRVFATEHGALRSSGWSMMAGALFVAPVAPFVIQPHALAAASPVALGAIVYLVLLTSTLAYILWGYALERAPASRVAVFSNLQPVATALAGWALLGEPIGWEVVVGGVAVLAGVRLAQR